MFFYKSNLGWQFLAKIPESIKKNPNNRLRRTRFAIDDPGDRRLLWYLTDAGVCVFEGNSSKIVLRIIQ